MSHTTDFGTASNLPVDVEIPGYRLRRQVGGDSIGLWFDVEQESLGRKLTLKILKPKYECNETARAQFLAEMDRLSDLDHANLTRVIDTQREGTLVLVTERVGVRSLAGRLAEGESLPVGQALRYAVEIARALHYLAGKGLAHKNLTPSLVMLREDNGVRLVTFRNIITAEEQAALKGKLAQDARYIAPEQLAGTHPVGPAAHVYQLGCLLFHMLAGRPPFEISDVKELARSHLTQAVPSLKRWQPFMDQSIHSFVAACTQRDPEARPSLAQAIAGLDDMIEGRDPGIAPRAKRKSAGKIPAPRPRRRRRRR